jgi:predicted phage terminase large subunit-like protein
MEVLRRIAQEEEKRRIRAERLARSSEIEAVRERCKTLSGFIREAWPVLEPATPYVHGWHIDVIAEHLEAITNGTFLDMGVSNRLLINVPPGTMKSLLTSVMWQAWEWGPRGLPSMRFLSTSYSDTYVTRDTRRTRDLVNSEWYQDHWGPDSGWHAPVSLTRFGETSFANTRMGTREGAAFKSLTGGRGDRLVIDDPHSTETAESDAERANTTRIFRESVPLRLNDAVTSAIVVIMQRLHHQDVSGQILSLNLGYQHIMLPMEFEPKRRCSTILGVQDRRSYDGELLFPERFPRETVDRDKIPMGQYAVAGQLQQRPTPREGGMFKRDWFQGMFVESAPAGTRWVRHWDLAASTTQTSPYTAGVKLGLAPNGTYIVGNVIRKRLEGEAVRELIKTTASMDGPEVTISLPQDPGQAGKVQKRDMIAMLAGYNARAEVETGDKPTRAEPFSAQCEAGNVYLVRGDWNNDYIEELCLFPGGSFADQVDATSGAFGRLNKAPIGTTKTKTVEMF